jgi:hypothetical protein
MILLLSIWAFFVIPVGTYGVLTAVYAPEVIRYWSPAGRWTVLVCMALCGLAIAMVCIGHLSDITSGASRRAGPP